MNLHGIFSGLTFQEVSEACKKRLNPELDQDKTALITLNNSISRTIFCNRMRKVVNLTHCCIALGSVFPFCIGLGLAVVAPLNLAEKVLKAYRHPLLGFAASATTYIGLEAATLGAIFFVSIPVIGVYRAAYKKVKSAFKPDLSFLEFEKAEERRSLVSLKIKEAGYKWEHYYMPRLKLIFALFSEGSKFANALPNELQVKILKLSMPFALEILEIATKEKIAQK
ncbi:hypothetical protein [Criblamydia sequanensis]|uniref:Membrane protein n=1 Tax=Candidatus Criblamydia sequanensis CRIB-18 TaxID=1437425 RepID=A0A090D2D7_9BACT|nr:hypothetical protein [Criblamydia sequanensis]CDR34238.1 putative membrane protein [Criblamydia sequanensis CRIB-18]